MMLRKYSLIGSALLGFLIPVQTIAYFTPEEILLSREFYLPPTAREAQGRAQDQVARSAEQRNREHALLEYRQEQPDADTLDQELFAEDVQEDSTLKTSALSLENLSASELQLLRTIQLLDSRQERLLDRVASSQNNLQYHAGAPPLAPTGAGGILAAFTMVGAVTWTIRQAKNSKKVISAA